jgi:hypothetical protein
MSDESSTSKEDEIESSGLTEPTFKLLPPSPPVPVSPSKSSSDTTSGSSSLGELFWPFGQSSSKPTVTPSSPLATPRRPLKQPSNENLFYTPCAPSPSLNNSSTLKKSVKFNRVDVFLFDRCQGFTSVPSSSIEPKKLPAVSIGMQYKHTESATFESLDDYFKYKRKSDINRLEAYFDQKVSELEAAALEKAKPKPTHKKTSPKKKMAKMAPVGPTTTTTLVTMAPPTREELIATDPELALISSILEEKEYYEANLDVKLEVNPEILCPILSTKERLDMLKNLDLEIDLDESTEIHSINESREVCGCLCGKFGLVCGDPDNDLCSCTQSGIMCQLDRFRYPCCCTVKKCKNPLGFKKFNCQEVLDHYKNVLYPAEEDEEKSSQLEEEAARIELTAPSVDETENEAPQKAAKKKPAPTPKGTRKRKRKATGSPTKKKKMPKLNANLIGNLNDSGTTSGDEEDDGVTAPLVELSDNSEPVVQDVASSKELSSAVVESSLLKRELSTIKSACTSLAANLENVLN